MTASGGDAGARLPAHVLRLARILLVVAGAISSGRAVARVPGFADYPAGPVATGPGKLVLRGTDINWRTMLRDGARRSPNFAGHYVLASWGCGTDCVMGAAIDHWTGRVIWLPGTICCWFHERADADVEPVSFRPNSRLLVLTGQRDEADGDDGIHLYRIDETRFVSMGDLPRQAGPD